MNIIIYNKNKNKEFFQEIRMTVARGECTQFERDLGMHLTAKEYSDLVWEQQCEEDRKWTEHKKSDLFKEAATEYKKYSENSKITYKDYQYSDEETYHYNDDEEDYHYSDEETYHYNDDQDYNDGYRIYQEGAVESKE